MRLTNSCLSLRFRTPNIRRSILESSPCTPTPFRSALAMQEAKYGPIKLLVRKKRRKYSIELVKLPSVVLLTHWEDFFFFQNSPLEQQMVDSIKQEPMECAIEQPPLKKIKQEVLSSFYVEKASSVLQHNKWKSVEIVWGLPKFARPIGGVPMWEESVYAVGRTRPSHTALFPKRPRTGSTCKLTFDPTVHESILHKYPQTLS